MVKKLVAIIVAIVLTAVVFSAGCTSNIGNNASPSPSASPQPTQDPNFVPKNTSGYLTYSNGSAGFTIQYPPSWPIGGGENFATFNISGSNVGGVYIYKDSQYSGTLNDYTQFYLNSSATLRDFKSLGCSNSTLSGYPSQKCSWTYTTTSGYPSQGFFEATVVNGTGYMISYYTFQSSYSANLETAQNIIQSFNIVS